MTASVPMWANRKITFAPVGFFHIDRVTNKVLELRSGHAIVTDDEVFVADIDKERFEEWRSKQSA